MPILARPDAVDAGRAENLALFDHAPGNGDGWRCMFDASAKQHHWFRTNAELGAAVARAGDRQGIYFATALFRERGSRKAENVVSRRAFCLDIDAGPDKVTKHGDAVYTDRNTAIRAVVEACKTMELAPAWIVGSGPHGLHVYFVVDRDLSLDEWLPLARDFKRLMKAVGLKADDTVTADAARVLRPLGSLHSSGCRVATLKNLGKVYSVDSFRAAVEAGLQRVAASGNVIPFNAPACAVGGLSMSATNASVVPQPGDEANEHTMLELRGALQHLAAAGHGASYPDWTGIGQALAALKGSHWEPQARDLFVTYSQACPGYVDDDDVLKKWAELPGQQTHWRAVFKRANDLGWKGLRAPARDETSADEAPVEDARPTDLALATTWAQRHSGLFRFDHPRKAWLAYLRGAWLVSSKEQQVESFKIMARELRRDAAAALAQAGTNEAEVAKAKRLMAAADRAQSANGTRAALSLAQSSPGIACTSDEFDRDPDLFNAANGVIHLPTGDLRPHGPELLLHRQSPVEFTAGATCPQFMAFMDQVSCHDSEWIDYMQRFLGHCLSGHVGEEKAQFWLGTGANGKSVLANLVRYIQGTYATSAPANFLMQSRREAGSATPELAMLPGIRVLMVNEVESGSRLSAQTLKTAVSTEHIAARHLYGAPFSFKPTSKVVIRGNHRPIITDDDEGIWRRFDLVPFDLNLTPQERDHGMEDRLRAEAPGILGWMVRGFAKWRQRGLVPCKRVASASLAYRRESDLLGQWLTDACDLGPALSSPQRAAFISYRQWCDDQGLRPMSKRSFTTGLRERGIGEGRESSGTRAHLYSGIQLRI